MLILKGCPPLYQQLMGPVLNHDLGIERHKKDALTSGCSPQLMKNAVFQSYTCTDSGPGEQQAVWNDRDAQREGQSGYLSHVDFVSSPRRAGNFFPAIRAAMEGFLPLSFSFLQR